MRLLIVDDEPYIRQMMRQTLETVGHSVDEAESGEEMLSKVDDGQRYDVVLLDQKMPGIDGLETLRRLKERVPDAFVVVVTALDSIEMAVDAMKFGATDFLKKPMTPQTLRSEVAAAVENGTQPPVRSAATGQRPVPIEMLTLNGFRILRGDSPAADKGEHVCRVIHFPDGAAVDVIVAVSPGVVARVARLTKRDLRPEGAFWRSQAERFLAAYLWSEGRVPDTNRLNLYDVLREDIDVAAAWNAD